MTYHAKIEMFRGKEGSCFTQNKYKYFNLVPNTSTNNHPKIVPEFVMKKYHSQAKDEIEFSMPLNKLLHIQRNTNNYNKPKAETLKTIDNKLVPFIYSAGRRHRNWLQKLLPLGGCYLRNKEEEEEAIHVTNKINSGDSAAGVVQKYATYFEQPIGENSFSIKDSCTSVDQSIPKGIIKWIKSSTARVRSLSRSRHQSSAKANNIFNGSEPHNPVNQTLPSNCGEDLVMPVVIVDKPADISVDANKTEPELRSISSTHEGIPDCFHEASLADNQIPFSQPSSISVNTNQQVLSKITEFDHLNPYGYSQSAIEANVNEKERKKILPKKRTCATHKRTTMQSVSSSTLGADSSSDFPRIPADNGRKESAFQLGRGRCADKYNLYYNPKAGAANDKRRLAGDKLKVINSHRTTVASSPNKISSYEFLQTSGRKKHKELLSCVPKDRCVDFKGKVSSSSGLINSSVSDNEEDKQELRFVGGVLANKVSGAEFRQQTDQNLQSKQTDDENERIILEKQQSEQDNMPRQKFLNENIEQDETKYLMTENMENAERKAEIGQLTDSAYYTENVKQTIGTQNDNDARKTILQGTIRLTDNGGKDEENPDIQQTQLNQQTSTTTQNELEQPENLTMELQLANSKNGIEQNDLNEELSRNRTEPDQQNRIAGVNEPHSEMENIDGSIINEDVLLNTSLVSELKDMQKSMEVKSDGSELMKDNLEDHKQTDGAPQLEQSGQKEDGTDMLKGPEHSSIKMTNPIDNQLSKQTEDSNLIELKDQNVLGHTEDPAEQQNGQQRRSPTSEIRDGADYVKDELGGLQDKMMLSSENKEGTKGNFDYHRDAATNEETKGNVELKHDTEGEMSTNHESTNIQAEEKFTGYVAPAETIKMSTDLHLTANSEIENTVLGDMSSVDAIDAKAAAGIQETFGQDITSSQDTNIKQAHSSLGLTERKSSAGADQSGLDSPISDKKVTNNEYDNLLTLNDRTAMEQSKETERHMMVTGHQVAEVPDSAGIPTSTELDPGSPPPTLDELNETDPPHSHQSQHEDTNIESGLRQLRSSEDPATGSCVTGGSKVEYTINLVQTGPCGPYYPIYPEDSLNKAAENTSEERTPVANWWSQLQSSGTVFYPTLQTDLQRGTLQPISTLICSWIRIDSNGVTVQNTVDTRVFPLEIESTNQLEQLLSRSYNDLSDDEKSLVNLIKNVLGVEAIQNQTVLKQKLKDLQSKNLSSLNLEEIQLLSLLQNLCDPDNSTVKQGGTPIFPHMPLGLSNAEKSTYTRSGSQHCFGEDLEKLARDRVTYLQSLPPDVLTDAQRIELDYLLALLAPENHSEFDRRKLISERITYLKSKNQQELTDEERRELAKHLSLPPGVPMEQLQQLGWPTSRTEVVEERINQLTNKSNLTESERIELEYLLSLKPNNLESTPRCASPDTLEAVFRSLMAKPYSNLSNKEKKLLLSILQLDSEDALRKLMEENKHIFPLASYTHLTLEQQKAFQQLLKTGHSYSHDDSQICHVDYSKYPPFIPTLRQLPFFPESSEMTPVIYFWPWPSNSQSEPTQNKNVSISQSQTPTLVNENSQVETRESQSPSENLARDILEKDSEM